MTSTSKRNFPKPNKVPIATVSNQSNHKDTLKQEPTSTADPISPLPAQSKAKYPRSRAPIPTHYVTKASDESLVAAAQRGSQTAFNTLIYRYRDDAFQLAYRILYKPGGRIDAPKTADDVTQEATFRAWKHIRSCDSPINFRAWYRSIVRNECKMLFRSLTKDWMNMDIYTDIETVEDNGNWMVSESPPPLHSVGDRWIEEPKIRQEQARANLEFQHYAKAIGLLPPRQRKVIVMKADGFSYKEISKELRISVKGVGSNLNKARTNLKKIVEKQLKEPKSE